MSADNDMAAEVGRLVRLLCSRDRAKSKQAEEALRDLGPGAVEPLAAILHRELRLSVVRRCCLAFFGVAAAMAVWSKVHGSDVGAVLLAFAPLAAAGITCPRRQRRVAEFLASIRDKRYLGPLLGAEEPYQLSHYQGVAGAAFTWVHMAFGQLIWSDESIDSIRADRYHGVTGKQGPSADRRPIGALLLGAPGIGRIAARALEFGRRRIRAASPLAEVLRLVTEEDTSLLTSADMQRLHKCLGYANLPLVLAATEALGRVGDAAADAAVLRGMTAHYFRHPARNVPALRDAARRSLASVETRIAARAATETLVRPAVAPDGGETLLRPVPAGLGNDDVAQLVRPVGE